MTISYSPIPAFLLGFLLATLIAGFVAVLVRFGRTREMGAVGAAVALGVALAVVGSVVAVGAYEAYVAQSTWHFSYYLSVEGNESASGSLIVPVPQDESLLAGLHLEAGSANWTLVSTPWGRGLAVQFFGAVVLEAYVSLFPPPANPPDARPTTMTYSNCTSGSSNCSTLPSVWVFYDGPSGVPFDLSMSYWQVRETLMEGWTAYELASPPMP